MSRTYWRELSEAQQEAVRWALERAADPSVHELFELEDDMELTRGSLSAGKMNEALEAAEGKLFDWTEF